MSTAKKVGCLILLLLLAGCPIYVSSYEYLNKTEQVRYRVSIYIDTPEGVRQGSGVWGRSFSPKLDPVFGFLGSGFNFGPRTQGEAILIDVGDGRRVYALLGGNSNFRKDGGQPEYSSGLLNILPEIAYFKNGYKEPIDWRYGLSKKRPSKIQNICP